MKVYLLFHYKEGEHLTPEWGDTPKPPVAVCDSINAMRDYIINEYKCEVLAVIRNQWWIFIVRDHNNAVFTMGGVERELYSGVRVPVANPHTADTASGA